MEFGDLGSTEEVVRVRERSVQAASAEIIASPLEHGVGERDRENLLKDGQIFLDELFLEIDGVGGDDRFFAVGDGVKDRWNKVTETFADAGACLDEKMG